MIERGLVPSPEIDPARFDMLVAGRRPLNRKAERYRSAGVIVMGLGVAMVFLLAFAAGVTKVAFGVGGALTVLGLAVFLNGLVDSSEDPPRPSA